VGALVDSPDYRVGRFTLQPFRQLVDGRRPVPIGRKALDLLSVLAKAEGALVTKDELMAAVWSKAIVEDNAIQVHIAALRKALGKDAELLSTVHGLGYRLVATPQVSSQVPGPNGRPKPARPFTSRRWTMPVLLAVLSVTTAAAGLWLVRDHLAWAPRPAEARVAVLPFDIIGPGQELRDVASGLFDEIVSQLSDSQILVVSKAQSQTLHGADAGQSVERLGVDLLFDGSVQSDGNIINVRVHLADAREHVIVWSGEFKGTAHETEALQASVAAQAADVLHWAKIGRSGKVRLDATTLADFIAGRESMTGVRNGSFAVALSDSQKVVAASPDFSWGHSAVAAANAYQLLLQPASSESEALRSDVRQEAKRALMLDPQNGEAYLALEMALPPLDWERREILLVRGAAVDPSFEPGAMMEGRLLWAVGRGHDALPWFERAHRLNPLFNGESWSLAAILASEGHPSDSRALVTRMQAQWPDHQSTRDARFWTSVIAGTSEDVLALLADPSSLPPEMDQRSVDAWRAALKAAPSKEIAVKTDAGKVVMAAANAGSLGHGEALTLLTMLGDLDDAFAQAQLYVPVNPYRLPYLFLPSTAAMRSDPRFMPLARKLGLVAYWRATGWWPDFCSEPGLSYDCRGEAAKVAAQLRRP
jgi:DNA-binding winged helix-turn-helix (wHTH) protein/TolB-like protein